MASYASSMRWVAWCAACCLLACGKSHADSSVRDVDSRGGQSTMGSAGLMEMGGSTGHEPEGGSPGNGGDTLDGRGGTGGSSQTAAGRGPTNAGAAGALLGAGAGNGGAAGALLAGNGGVLASAGMGGAAGSSAGAAGASTSACDDYLACGCGCCGGTAPDHACYYPDRGDTLERIVADDQALAADAACAGAGCAKGTLYWCCVPPSEGQPATYRTDSFQSDAYDRFVLIRADEANNCTVLSVSSIIEPPKFPIEVPEGWKVDVGSSGFNCNSIYNFPNQRIAIGGEGFVSFTTPDRCAIDFDFTLYFDIGDDAPAATRFVGQGVPTPNLGSSCN